MPTILEIYCDAKKFDTANTFSGRLSDNARLESCVNSGWPRARSKECALRQVPARHVAVQHAGAPAGAQERAARAHPGRARDCGGRRRAARVAAPRLRHAPAAPLLAPPRALMIARAPFISFFRPFATVSGRTVRALARIGHP
jgi:hypothetical protein